MASAIHARCAVRGVCAQGRHARAHSPPPSKKKHIKPLKKSQLCLTQADRFAKIALVLLVLKFERVEIVVILAWR